MLVGAQAIDRKVQMGRVFWGIPGNPHVPQDLPPIDPVSFFDSVGVPIQVGVVVGVLLAGIELVEGQPSGLAGEHLRNRAVLDCNHGCMHRRQDVDGLVLALPAPAVVIRAHELVRRNPGDGNGEFPRTEVDGLGGARWDDSGAAARRRGNLDDRVGRIVDGGCRGHLRGVGQRPERRRGRHPRDRRPLSGQSAHVAE